jgi:hypothetical protein
VLLKGKMAGNFPGKALVTKVCGIGLVVGFDVGSFHPGREVIVGLLLPDGRVLGGWG